MINLLSVSYFGFSIAFHAFKMEVDIVVSCVLILSFTFLCPYVRGNLFKEVSSCPSDGVEWRERAQKKQCREPIPDFMCAAIENQPGRFGEICTIAGLSTAGTNVMLLYGFMRSNNF